MKKWPVRVRLTLLGSAVFALVLAGFGGAGGLLVPEAARHDLLISWLTAGSVLLGAGAAGIWWLLGVAYRPVDRLTAAAGRITAQNLGEHLPDGGVDDEIGRLARVLNQMIDRLATSFAQASRFSADASHELKTPLTILRNDLEGLLRDPHLDQRTQAMLTGFLEQVTRLTAISQKLALLSRADAGRLPLRREPVNLGEMLEMLVEDAAILGSARGVAVDSQSLPGVRMSADREFLHQLFLNLLDNAVKYNHYGGRVEVELQVRAHQAEVHIANTGPGIPAEHARNIFERFHRAGHRGQVSGHGLGLSLCREIVVAHGGTIELAVNDPEFTEFRVVLPLRQP